MSQQERDDRDLQLQTELKHALEEYRQAAKAEKNEAKQRYMEMLRQFSRLIMTGQDSGVVL